MTQYWLFKFRKMEINQAYGVAWNRVSEIVTGLTTHARKEIESK